MHKTKQRKRYSIISAISINKIINVKIINVKIIKGSINSEVFTSYADTIENKIIYNVPYCSELNPIEMVFSKVKSIVPMKILFADE